LGQRGASEKVMPMTQQFIRTAREFVLGTELRTAILATSQDTDGRFDMIDSFLVANASEPLHLHTRYEEHFYILSGSLLVWAGDDHRTLRPGDY
jgi:mannose-6-phosphate isomerase-like protein (cupin superfamily)